MKAIGIFLMFFSSLLRAEPILEGNWQSNHGLTMAFIEANVKTSDRQLAFLNKLFGNLAISFSEGTVKMNLPDIDMVIDDRPQKLEGFKSQQPFKVIFTGKNVVVIETIEPVTHQPTIIAFNFIDKNTMWLYTGGVDKALPDSHYREYFNRVK